MGRPSKYLIFPVVSAGMRATVALNLARRASPQATERPRRRVSRDERRPRVKARKAGATPNETCEASKRRQRKGWFEAQQESLKKSTRKGVLGTSAGWKGKRAKSREVCCWFDSITRHTLLLPPSHCPFPQPLAFPTLQSAKKG